MTAAVPGPPRTTGFRHVASACRDLDATVAFSRNTPGIAPDNQAAHELVGAEPSAAG